MIFDILKIFLIRIWTIYTSEELEKNSCLEVTNRQNRILFCSYFIPNTCILQQSFVSILSRSSKALQIVESKLIMKCENTWSFRKTNGRRWMRNLDLVRPNQTVTSYFMAACFLFCLVSEMEVYSRLTIFRINCSISFAPRDCVYCFVIVKWQ